MKLVMGVMVSLGIMPHDTFRRDFRVAVVAAFLLFLWEIVIGARLFEAGGGREAIVAWVEQGKRLELGGVLGVAGVGLSLFLGVAFVGSSVRRRVDRWVVGEIVRISRKIFFMLTVVLLWAGVSNFAAIVVRPLGGSGGWYFSDAIDVLSFIVPCVSGYFLLLLGSRVVVGPEVAHEQAASARVLRDRIFRLALWLGCPAGCSFQDPRSFREQEEWLGRELRGVSFSVEGGLRLEFLNEGLRRSSCRWLVAAGVWSWWGHLILGLVSILSALVVGLQDRAGLFLAVMVISIMFSRRIGNEFAVRVQGVVGNLRLPLVRGIRFLGALGLWVLVVLLTLVFPDGKVGGSMVFLLAALGSLCGFLLLVNLLVFDWSWVRKEDVERLLVLWDYWEGESDGDGVDRL